MRFNHEARIEAVYEYLYAQMGAAIRWHRGMKEIVAGDNNAEVSLYGDGFAVSNYWELKGCGIPGAEGPNIPKAWDGDTYTCRKVSELPTLIESVW